MRIDYHTDTNGWLWAVIARADGTYGHWFIGSKDRAVRIAVMYRQLIRTVAE